MEAQPHGAPKSEPNRPEKAPERVFGLSTEKGLTILTEIFTRQIPQNLKSVTVKITGIPKIPSIFLVGHSYRRLGKQVTAFSTHTQRPLSVNLAKFPTQNSPEFEVGNGKNYRHPKKSPIFYSRSVKNLVRMVKPL